MNTLPIFPDSMFSKRSFFTRISLLLTLLLACSLAQADQLDDLIRSAMTEQHIPGLTIAVIQNKKVVTTRAYGLSNVELNVPLTVNSAFEIGSMTKQVTAFAIMLLVEEGKIVLDEKIATYLTGLPALWKDITVRNLLNHTSGLHEYTDVGDFGLFIGRPSTPAEILKLISDLPLDDKTGEQCSYRNTNYYLAAMIIEKASGKSYDEFLRTRLFDPLGMKTARNTNPKDIIAHRTQGYSWDGKLMNEPHLQPSYAFGAGELECTIKDMAQWDRGIQSGALLKRASYLEMRKPAPLNNGTTGDFGFGWRITTQQGHALVWHGGGTYGYVSLNRYYPDDSLSIVLLSNYHPAELNPIADRIAELYLPSLKEPGK